MYSLFPEHLSQDWAGYVQVPPLHLPVPLGAVVPKFYGLYTPEPAEPKLDADSDEAETKPQKPILIMLMEECGKPIDPDKLTPFEKFVPQLPRKLSWSHLLRLHVAGFAQGSFYARNILVQPGPLCLPPSLRAMERPSYRIIDFGRGRAMRDFDMSAPNSDMEGFFPVKHEDQLRAVSSLGIGNMELVSSMRIGGREGEVVDEVEQLPLD
ncbi:hypothetical protein BOTBODRAFT_34350 [Botryobasidium botryosum FD-172 SS1]|uniref:Protein kinase domain-containing protein n=1 Tax=Botryobasidium botryosum (strain FD-172 SS1) TaxID=930990 RepID=A0A067MD49_BOTB1|nr:hypothetical protein BOTBODRAFT_34350 [Botryobasidium botryosum FD-172 SS1]